MATILFLAGAQEVNSNISFYLGYKRSLKNLIHTNNSSVSVTPYIKHPIIGNDTLFWYLLRKANIRFSGAASEEGKTYAQASSIDADFWNKLIVDFSALKFEFGSRDNSILFEEYLN